MLLSIVTFWSLFFFFFNDTATTEIYTLSLHDALPIWPAQGHPRQAAQGQRAGPGRSATAPAPGRAGRHGDRKSTRLNSSHLVISYAVFCLKKKKIRQEFLKLSKNIVLHHTIRLV